MTPASTETDARPTAVEPSQPRSGFRIFRGPGAALDEHMQMTALDDAMRANLAQLREAQGSNATESRYLFGGPGMSLSSVWFKSGYPVPLHSHDADCLYYILAGSIRLGAEVLGPDDGFFVPADVPYTYVAGPEGVELLEFRTAVEFNIRFASSNQTYWAKTLATIAGRRQFWTDEVRPSGRLQTVA